MLDALLAMGFLLLLLWGMRQVTFFRDDHFGNVLPWVFLLKALSGTALWYVYTYLYTDRATADLYKYFDDSAVMFSALPERPMDYLRMLLGIGNDTQYFTDTYYVHMNNWFREYEGNLYNDSHTMIRFNALVRLISFGSLHVHTVFACALSLIGLTALYKAIAPQMPGKEYGVGAALFFIPSVLFWGSGVIKESLLFFALGSLVMQVFRWMRNGPDLRGALIVLLCTTLLFFLKFYVLVSMIPGLLALYWCRRSRGRVFPRFAGVLALFALIALNVQYIIPGFNVLEVLYWKHRDFIGLAQSMDSGSFLDPVSLRPDIWSFVKAAPHALYITLFGPIHTATDGLLGAMAGMETIALLALVVLILRRRRSLAEVDLALVLYCLSFVLLLSLMIGYTTPVMGAVVRYRTPLLPFVVIAVLAFSDVQSSTVRPFNFNRSGT
ncbi:MAG: hypothetical protein KDB88_02875 [Flavobacteriales bacterium]|nr:hypothetical protein [Flavobacteriales bacterium]